MRTNRIFLPLVMTIIAAVSISSCTYRSYGPGYDPGYGYGYGYGYRVPPPRRVVVVRPAHPRTIYADRNRSSRRNNDPVYRRQNNRSYQYGSRSRTYGPR